MRAFHAEQDQVPSVEMPLLGEDSSQITNFQMQSNFQNAAAIATVWVKWVAQKELILSWSHLSSAGIMLWWPAWVIVSNEALLHVMLSLLLVLIPVISTGTARSYFSKAFWEDEPRLGHQGLQAKLASQSKVMICSFHRWRSGW